MIARTFRLCGLLIACCLVSGTASSQPLIVALGDGVGRRPDQCVSL